MSPSLELVSGWYLTVNPAKEKNMKLLTWTWEWLASILIVVTCPLWFLPVMLWEAIEETHHKHFGRWSRLP